MKLSPHDLGTLKGMLEAGADVFSNTAIANAVYVSTNRVSQLRKRHIVIGEVVVKKDSTGRAKLKDCYININMRRPKPPLLQPY